MENSVQPPSSNDGAGAPSNKSDRNDTYAKFGIFVGLAAVIVALVAVASDRRLAAALLAIGALAMGLAWWLGSITSTEFFMNGLKGTTIVVLVVLAVYLVVVTPGPAVISPKPQAPKIFFTDGPTARVPYCRAYTVQADIAIPPGFQVVMFDAPTSGGDNVTGVYNYDDQALPVSSDRYEDKHLYIGSETNKPGLEAVVIAGVIADREAKILDAVLADPHTGWGLKNLPPLLSRTELQVTRTSDGLQCSGLSG
jgi:hypothetical protein